jgi:zinc and cadmium transporter
MPPLPAVTTAGQTSAAVLVVQLAVIAAAACAGGSSLSLLSLGHRRMQVLLSVTGGVLLGVGMLHLLPHAYLEFDGRLDPTMLWVVAGFFLMFLLERAFHGHSHHTADGGEAPGGCCGHDHQQHEPQQHPHDHHAHGHHGNPGAAGQAAAGRWAWCGAFAGLALHSLADGAALAASVQADAEHGGGWLAGFATFLAVLLHKPFDAAIIGTLMMRSGVDPARRRLVNGLYAAVVPLGAVLFLASLRLYGGEHGPVLGAALGLAAGAFVCIAAADLLPEVQFHSHDRVLLTTSLALGLAIAWGITVLEKSSHAHAHGHARPHARGHIGEPAAP